MAGIRYLVNKKSLVKPELHPEETCIVSNIPTYHMQNETSMLFISTFSHHYSCVSASCWHQCLLGHSMMDIVVVSYTKITNFNTKFLLLAICILNLNYMGSLFLVSEANSGHIMQLFPRFIACIYDLLVSFITWTVILFLPSFTWYSLSLSIMFGVCGLFKQIMSSAFQ